MRADSGRYTESCGAPEMSPGYRGLRDGAAWFSISDRTRIRLTGDDRIRLLHALATNAIEGLAPGESRETFFLNPQGRILAHCRVFIAADSVLLETEGASRQPLLGYLDQYIIMDDVTVSDESNSTEAIAIEGPQTRLALTPELAALGVVHRAALTGPDGVWLQLLPDRLPQFLDLLTTASIVEANKVDQQAARVENGIPAHRTDYSDANIPHETQLLDIVSFEKGCYVGQEIVERVKSQGQVNRLLTAVEIESAQLPANLDVHLGDRSVGQLSSPIVSPQSGKVRGFALLRRAAFVPGSQLTVAGQTAHILPWP
jgi:folate-binding protein YgfZ